MVRLRRFNSIAELCNRLKVIDLANPFTLNVMIVILLCAFWYRHQMTITAVLHIHCCIVSAWLVLLGARWLVPLLGYA